MALLAFVAWYSMVIALTAFGIVVARVPGDIAPGPLRYTAMGVLLTMAIAMAIAPFTDWARM